jgi:uncharacterized membrane protein
MSIVIAYLLIGLAMSLGLMLDRWSAICSVCIGRRPEVVVVAIVAAFVVLAWPLFFNKENMDRCHD